MSTTILQAKAPDASAMHALVAELEQRMNALRGAAVDHTAQIKDAEQDLEQQRRLLDLDRARLHKEIAALGKLRDQMLASKGDLDAWRAALDAERAQLEGQWQVLEEQRRLQGELQRQLERQRQAYAVLESQLGQRGLALGVRVARVVEEASALIEPPDAVEPQQPSMALAA